MVLLIKGIKVFDIIEIKYAVTEKDVPELLQLLTVKDWTKRKRFFSNHELATELVFFKENMEYKESYKHYHNYFVKRLEKACPFIDRDVSIELYNDNAKVNVYICMYSPLNREKKEKIKKVVKELIEEGMKIEE